jgi:hypothetical protein
MARPTILRRIAMRTITSVVVMCLALTAGLSAAVTGSISGTVKDNTEAVLPHVTVIATNQATGVTSTTQTNDVGVYSFLALPAGRYQVEIRQDGFKDFRQTNINLSANSALRLDVTLVLGTLSDTVEVSANAVHVETMSTQMGDVIDANKMTGQPLNGRSYIDLLGLQPGVVPVNSRNQGGGVSGNLPAGNLSVGGQRENANGFMINGGLVEEQVNNGAAVIPNLDSIAEFRVLTNVFDAEYGHYSGGLVNVITKSGANQVHGVGFEFFRNQKLDANDWFNNYNHVARGAYDRHQAGGTFGGPITRDKMFYFADYQGTREQIGTPLTTIVPSDAQRAGDFSDVAGSLADTVKGSAWAQVLSKRLGYPVRAGEPYYSSGCTSSANCVFPNARIPASAFASPAGPLLKLLPSPNGALQGQPSFSTSAFNNVLQDNKWSGRADANTRFGMLSAYYFFDQSLVDNPYPAANVPGFNANTWLRAQQLNLSDTKTLGSATVNEFRFNFLRNSTLRNQYAGGVGVSLASLGFVTGPGTLGIVGVIPGLESVPNISTHNWTIGTPQGQTGIYSSIFQWLDNVSLLRGNHTVKFGGEFHYSKVDERNTYAPNGSFSFDGSETGNDLADFLIGAPATYIQATQQLLDSRTVYVGAYAQDSWRVSPRLTLNYGVRWEVSPFWWDTENKIQTIVPGLQSTVYPGAPKGWVFPGDPGIPRTLAPTHYDNVAPRVGLAYSPDAKGGVLGALLGGTGQSSIHGSWGRFFTAVDDSQLFIEVGDAPFGLYWFSPQPPMFETPFVDRATGQSQGQRFPRPLPKPGDTNIDWPAFLPIASSPGIATSARLPYSDNFSLSFQRQLRGRTVWNAAYVGSRGHRLLASVEANPGSPELCLSLSKASQVAPGSPTCGRNGENEVYTRANGEVVYGTRSPLGIDFATGNQYMTTIASSSYNALQTSVRFSGSVASFLASYTYSKSMDNASTRGDALNPFTYTDPQALSVFDLKHNFVVSYSYTVPFERLAGHPSRLLSGWTISGVTRFTSGFPITLTESDDRSLIGTFGVDRPQFNGGDLTPNDPRVTLNWINNAKKVFSVEPLGEIGNAPRRFFYGPGMNNTDLALLKSVNVTKRTSLQLRAELFNAFNHAQFLNPSGSINSSSFMVIRRARSPRIGQLAVKLVF